MIIQKNTFKQQSEAECDMCKIRIAGVDRVSIKVGLGNDNAKKKWDLCKKCYKKLERAVENYYSRKEKEENGNKT